MSTDWFYAAGDTRLGPVSEDDLKRLATDGKLKPGDLVWRDGMPDWVEARTVDALFPKVDSRRPLENGYAEDRPSRRGTPRRRDDDDDRPSRRGSSRRRDRDDELDEDDDRPRVRRREERYEDDYDDRPRSRRGRQERPGQIQAVGIMLLCGGIFGVLVFLGFAASLVGLCWPPIYFELVMGILAIIRGANMLGKDDQGPPKAISICLIICILNGDIIACVLGIVCLVMLNDEQVQKYYRRKGFEA